MISIYSKTAPAGKEAMYKRALVKLQSLKEEKNK